MRLLFPTAGGRDGLGGREFRLGSVSQGRHPLLARSIVSVALLDFAIYLQHVMVHAIPVLWRLHTVHHADVDFDVTTGIRFHPFDQPQPAASPQNLS